MFEIPKDWYDNYRYFIKDVYILLWDSITGRVFTLSASDIKDKDAGSFMFFLNSILLAGKLGN